MGMVTKKKLGIATALVVLASLVIPTSPVSAATDPYIEDEIIREIVFPILGETHYTDTFLAPRGSSRLHLGVDIMGTKGDTVVAVRDSCVTWLRYAGEGSTSTNMVIMTDSDGWEYYYIHLNNDSPGTDDGANRRDEVFINDLQDGDCVEAGDPIAYVGDSGAEWAGAHLHLEIRMPDVAINPYFSVVAAEANGSCSNVTNPEANPSADSGLGYWVLSDDGRVHAVEAEHYGDLLTAGVTTRPVSMQSTISGQGYWIVDEDGVVHPFGDAEFLGDMSEFELQGVVQRIETLPDGSGYWLVGSDGGIFSFGAPFLGSMGGQQINSPVISMSTTASGDGYFLVAGDGGVFSFGDAEFRGSTGNLKLAAPVISMAVHPSGDGYWLYARDGGVFAYDVPFYGSVPGMGLCNAPQSVALRVSDTGGGYWVLGADGQVFAFGDAMDFGSIGTLGGAGAIDLAVQHHAPIEDET